MMCAAPVNSGNHFEIGSSTVNLPSCWRSNTQAAVNCFEMDPNGVVHLWGRLNFGLNRCFSVGSGIDQRPSFTIPSEALGTPVLSRTRCTASSILAFTFGSNASARRTCERASVQVTSSRRFRNSFSLRL